MGSGEGTKAVVTTIAQFALGFRISWWGGTFYQMKRAILGGCQIDRLVPSPGFSVNRNCHPFDVIHSAVVMSDRKTHSPWKTRLFGSPTVGVAARRLANQTAAQRNHF